MNSSEVFFTNGRQFSIKEIVILPNNTLTDESSVWIMRSSGCTESEIDAWKDQRAKWKAQHPYDACESMISWIERKYKINKVKVRINKHKKKLRKYKHNISLRPALSSALRFQILTRDNFHCRYCGRGVEDKIKLVVDHIISVKDGGSTIPANLITACFDCNIGKTKHSLLRHNKQIPSFLVIGGGRPPKNGRAAP